MILLKAAPDPPPPTLGPTGTPSGGCQEGGGAPRAAESTQSPHAPSLLPGLQALQHQCCLGLGFLQEAGDMLAGLTDIGPGVSLHLKPIPTSPGPPPPPCALRPCFLACPLWGDPKPPTWGPPTPRRPLSKNGRVPLSALRCGPGPGPPLSWSSHVSHNRRGQGCVPEPRGGSCSPSSKSTSTWSHGGR